jgi:hypothetical protein
MFHPGTRYHTLPLTLIYLGYTYEKIGDNRRVLYDQVSIINYKCNYLRKIKSFREAGYDIVQASIDFQTTQERQQYSYPDYSHHPLIWPETLNRSCQSNPHFTYLHAKQSNVCKTSII